MANEINELSQLIDQTNKQLKSFNDSLNKNIKSDTIYNNALKSTTESLKDSAENEKMLGKAISTSISGLTGFAKQLSAGQGSFAPLTTVISLTTKALGKLVGGLPFVGKALKGLAEGAGEVANFMVESFDKAYGTFEKISDSGVVSTFESLKVASSAMQLNFSQTENVLTKHSKNLALFAGSAVRGRQEFEKIAVSSLDIRKSFQKLGIGGEEFSEMQLSYINQQMRSGQGQKKTTDELTAGSIEYIKQLDAISKLTGMSKKDIQAEREARMSDARYRAGVADLPGQIREEADTLLDMIKATGADATKQGIQDLISSNGVATSKAAQDVLNSYAGSTTELLAIVKGIRSGSIKAGEGMNQLTAISAKSAELFKTQAAQRGQELSYTKNYAEVTNIAIKNGQDQQAQFEKYKKEQEAIIKNTTSVNSQLADTKQSLEQAQRDIEQMSTSSTLITALMKNLSEGIESVTVKFYKMAGQDLPAHLQAREDEKDALKEEKEALAALKKAEEDAAKNAKISGRAGRALAVADWATLEFAKKRLAEKEKLAREATEKRKAADAAAGIGGTQPTTAAPQTQPPPGSGEPSVSTGGALQLSTVTSKSGQTARVATEYAKNFQGLINWFDNQGYNIKSMGGYNDRNIAGTNIPSYHKKGAAIDINPAENPMGSQRITDMPAGTNAAASAMGLGWGLNWSNKSDAMHFSAGRHEGGTLIARTGGIFSGPSSGYLAELHGTEAVVPSDVADSGPVNQRPLGSGLMTSKSNNFEKVYSNLSEKMDMLIDLMDYSLENQQDFLSARLN